MGAVYQKKLNEGKFQNMQITALLTQKIIGRTPEIAKTIRMTPSAEDEETHVTSLLETSKKIQPLNNVKMIKDFLKWDFSKQEGNTGMLFQNMNELHALDWNLSVPMEMFTEEILMVFIDVFALAVQKNYPTDLVDKIVALKSHWRKTVRILAKEQRRLQTPDEVV